jgi:hypothetical protein
VTSTIDSDYFPLTSKSALFRFMAVFSPRMKHPHALLRLVSAGILLFVFFLPLHFHSVAAKAHVTKECSCVHGTRTEAGLAVASAAWAPVLLAQPVVIKSLDWLSNVRFQNHGIRAPPSQLLCSS